MDQACESLSSGEADQLRQRFSDAEKALQRHTESFIRLTDKVLGDTHLKLPEVARTQLRQARENPSLVTVMLQASQLSFDENVKVNRIADEHLAEERAGLSSWLTNFTLRLPDNLKTLRAVLAPKVDQTSKTVLRAGFVVEAKVIDSEGVQTLIESIIQDVENYEDNEQAKESSVRDHLRKSLREDIRRNFYQKVIVNPRIHLVLPAMSATPLEMERDMASSGQESRLPSFGSCGFQSSSLSGRSVGKLLTRAAPTAARSVHELHYPGWRILPPVLEKPD